MKLKQRNNGYYYICYNWRKKKSLRTQDKALAIQLFNAEKQFIRDGKIIELDKISKIRLSQFIFDYIGGNDKLPNRTLDVSPGTIDNDRLSFKKFIEMNGDLILQQVNRGHIDTFKEKSLRKGLSKTYIDIMLRSLRSAFFTAAECGYIPEANNPFKKKGKKSILFKSEEEDIPRYFELAEIKTFFEKIDDPEFRFAMEICLYLGLRREELVRLQITDVNMQNFFVTIRDTKSKKDRTVPIPEEYHETLKTKLQALGRDIGPLFPKWRSPDTMSRLFHKYAVKAGLKGTLHGLRHSYGTYLRMAGVGIEDIKEMMGHQDIKTTMIYAKIVNEKLKREANKFRLNLNTNQTNVS